MVDLHEGVPRGRHLLEDPPGPLSDIPVVGEGEWSVREYVGVNVYVDELLGFRKGAASEE